MERIQHIINVLLHMDKDLLVLIQNYGYLVYALLFAILFMETGLVVVPFLPGDSLLFAAGALAALGWFNIFELYLIVVAAAVLGDTVNYWIGHSIGPKAFKLNTRFLKQEYLEKAEAFYEKHGGKTIILARFIPIIRTFAPFVAGIGEMKYSRFIMFNLVGGIVWTALFTFGGYFLGNIPIIKDNFHYTVILIILISIVPVVLEFTKSRKKSVSKA